MWNTSPWPIRSARILSSYWQLLLKKYIILKKNDCWKPNMCKWRLNMFVSDMLAFSVSSSWCEEDVWAWSPLSVQEVLCIVTQVIIIFLQLFDSVLSILVKIQISVLLVEIPLVFECCHSSEVPVLHHGCDSCVRFYCFSECCCGSLPTQLCRSWQCW